LRCTSRSSAELSRSRGIRCRRANGARRNVLPQTTSPHRWKAWHPFVLLASLSWPLPPPAGPRPSRSAPRRSRAAEHRRTPPALRHSARRRAQLRGRHPLPLHPLNRQPCLELIARWCFQGVTGHHSQTCPSGLPSRPHHPQPCARRAHASIIGGQRPTGVPATTLRYYDELGLVRPAARAAGRRRYAEALEAPRADRRGA
jgi:hypothetical protein